MLSSFIKKRDKLKESGNELYFTLYIILNINEIILY